VTILPPICVPKPDPWASQSTRPLSSLSLHCALPWAESQWAPGSLWSNSALDVHETTCGCSQQSLPPSPGLAWVPLG
jgi:hypothetical protein